MVWRFLEIHMNFMIIRSFLMYFADFRANFCVFLTIILFYWLKWVLKKPLLLEKYYGNNWLQFCGQESFFVEKYDKKMAKIGTNFLNFCIFSFFFLFLAKSLCLLWLAYCFAEHLDTLLAEGNFSLDLYVFWNIKILVTFSSFSVKLFLRVFFHNLA